ncbi:hypothetical protein M948_19390 [Virgibacillus sp. CM-4]|uniref:hypothetical protein n=1 Tax=Virgibacillus sp. CM-4 TaxID=1354277 RepID=UPI0003884FF8|nr:hypothetical protein [Virgibacillus sp. CM-4]EQB35265.1 hypothetical protein M948_19390 [Virgibacillus sp. CM-4]
MRGCVYKKHTYWGALGSGDTELIVEDREGNQSPLICGELTLNLDKPNRYYTLICDGQILAQGIYDNIFNTLSELTRHGLRYPDKVEGSGWAMDFDDYRERGENVEKTE